MKLIIEDDEGRKTVVPFVRDEITIGRQEGNTIRLTERNVSRRHARLLRQNGHILVEDLGSYNGIRINGDRIQGQVQVNEGDLIQIGDYNLAVQREGAEAAAAAASHAAAHDKTQEVEAFAAGRTNGANTNAVTKPLTDNQATVPALPTIDPITGAVEEPDEANPEDVTLQPTTTEDPAARRQSTAIIRMDQVEKNPSRAIVDIDPADAPRLIILNTELAGREFSCVRSELKIGRTDENDIAIDHRSLSRTHCKVVREDTMEWRVIDMQSANGLMVNGESYAQSALRSGDVLELGHVKMKFVGAGEKYDAADAVADAQNGGGSKMPAVAAAAAVVVLLAGIGVWFVKFRTPPKVAPPPVVDPGPAVTPRDIASPAELTPEQQQKVVEAKLKDARSKIDALQWADAIKILETCYVGESMHPEATKLITELRSEEPLRTALEKADQLIDQDDLKAAKVQLDSAEHSRFLQARWGEVNEKYGKASAKKIEESTVKNAEPGKVVPPPQPPPTKPPPPQPPPANTGRAEAEKLIEEARTFYKLKNKEGWEQAKIRLEKCIKADKSYPDCHMLLGACLGQLGNGEGGAREYEKFLELAPDHPKAPQVRQLLEAFRAGKPK